MISCRPHPTSSYPPSPQPVILSQEPYPPAPLTEEAYDRFLRRTGTSVTCSIVAGVLDVLALAVLPFNICLPFLVLALGVSVLAICLAATASSCLPPSDPDRKWSRRALVLAVTVLVISFALGSAAIMSGIVYGLSPWKHADTLLQAMMGF